MGVCVCVTQKCLACQLLLQTAQKHKNTQRPSFPPSPSIVFCPLLLFPRPLCSLFLSSSFSPLPSSPFLLSPQLPGTVIDLDIRAASACNGSSSSTANGSSAGVFADELEDPVVFTFLLPGGVPTYQLVAVFWNDTKRKENCTSPVSNLLADKDDDPCIGAWDTEGVTLVFPNTTTNAGSAAAKASSPHAHPYARGHWRRAAGGDNSTMMAVQVEAKHLKGRAYGVSIDFTLEAPDVSIANFDPANAPYIWVTFGSLVGFVVIVLLYSWIELRAYEYRENLISGLHIHAKRFSEDVWDLEMTKKHGFAMALLVRFGWYLKSRHAWAAVLLPQGLSARPKRTLKVLALVASVSMAVAMNSVFSYAAVKNPDKEVNSIHLVLDGESVYIPLEGIYAFALTFPFFLALSMAFARFAKLLEKLQQLAPELYSNRIPHVPVAEPLAATWAVSSIRHDAEDEADALGTLDVRTAMETGRRPKGGAASDLEAGSSRKHMRGRGHHSNRSGDGVGSGRSSRSGSGAELRNEGGDGGDGHRRESNSGGERTAAPMREQGKQFSTHSFGEDTEMLGRERGGGGGGSGADEQGVRRPSSASNKKREEEKEKEKEEKEKEKEDGREGQRASNDAGTGDRRRGGADDSFEKMAQEVGVRHGKYRNMGKYSFDEGFEAISALPEGQVTDTNNRGSNSSSSSSSSSDGGGGGQEGKHKETSFGPMATNESAAFEGAGHHDARGDARGDGQKQQAGKRRSRVELVDFTADRRGSVITPYHLSDADGQVHSAAELSGAPTTPHAEKRKDKEKEEEKGDDGERGKADGEGNGKADGEADGEAEEAEEGAGNGMTQEEIHAALVELHKRMMFWRRVCFVLSSVLILGGWVLCLVFMGSVEREKQERWLKGCLEFVLLSAIITAPLVLLISAIRRQYKLHKLRRKHSAAEWDEKIREEKKKTTSIAATMTQAMLFVEIGRAVRANFDIYIL